MEKEANNADVEMKKKYSDIPMLDKDFWVSRIDRYMDGARAIKNGRHDEWDTNSDYYHGKTKLNRITQRQTVCSPATLTACQTTMAQVPTNVDIYFRGVVGSGDDIEKRLATEKALNNYWDYCYNNDNYEAKGEMSKKNMALYGREFKKVDIRNRKLEVDVIDPYKIYVDQYTDPEDMQTAHYVALPGYDWTIGEIARSKDFDKKEVDALVEAYIGSQSVQDDNIGGFENKQEVSQRVENLGMQESEMIGEAVFELSEIFIKLDNPDEVKQAIIDADEEYKKTIKEDGFAWYRIIKYQDYYLMNEPLLNSLGVNELPIESAPIDIEKNNFWSQGIADIARQNNKLQNTLLSQMVENRALVNSNPIVYNTELDEFNPAEIDISPGVFIGVNGEPDKVLRPLPVQGLEENLTQINWFDSQISRATGATALLQGVREQGEQTLGEVQLINANAQNRLAPFTRYYSESWKKIARIWLNVLIAKSDELKDVKMYKMSDDGTYVASAMSNLKKIKGDFDIQITTDEENKQKDIESIQTIDYLLQKFPDPYIQGVLAKKLVGLPRLENDERMKIKEIIEAKTQQGESPVNNQMEAQGQIGSALTGGDNAGIPSALAPQAMQGQNTLT